jgi:hypothetical protein
MCSGIRVQQSSRSSRCRICRERNIAERSGGPDYLEQGAFQTRLEAQGWTTKPASIVLF